MNQPRVLKHIDVSSQEYPVLLRQISHPPKSLFLQGELPPPDDPSIAVVGSRKCSGYGRRVARDITTSLARAGVVIVSGMAYGIDETAHEAAVDAGGKTIAVLGCAFDKLSSIEQQPLADRILDHNGCILTEFPTGTPGYKGNFPQRNRIISGLSLGVLVIEATSSSGSLITAKWALDQGREVFAVPGPVYSETSQGTNGLLKSGAHVVTSAHDVLDVLGLSGVALTEEPSDPPKADTKEEAILLPLVTRQPIHLDDIIRASGLPAGTVNACMTMMEIKAKIRHVGGKYYIRA